MTIKNNNEKEIALAVADPYSGSSLLPMLVSGLVMIVVGMIASRYLAEYPLIPSAFREIRLLKRRLGKTKSSPG